MKKQSESEFLRQLSAPLPAEALRKSYGFGIAINDAFVKERLNQVLGPSGWLWEPQPKILTCELWRRGDGSHFCDADGAPYWEVTAEVSILIPLFKKTFYGQGGWRSTDRGNARKGAITDAFGKALSDIIGAEVYKGELDQEYCLSQKGARSIYLTGFESGLIAAQTVLGTQMTNDQMGEVIKQARKEWNAKEKVED